MALARAAPGEQPEDGEDRRAEADRKPTSRDDSPQHDEEDWTASSGREKASHGEGWLGGRLYPAK